MASAHLILQRYATALHELAHAAGGNPQVEQVDAALIALAQGIARQPGGHDGYQRLGRISPQHHDQP